MNAVAWQKQNLKNWGRGEKEWSQLNDGPRLNFLLSLLLLLFIISTSGLVLFRSTAQEQIQPSCPHESNCHKHLTNMQIIWHSSKSAHLLTQQKVYPPISKDSCICNKPIAFDMKLITSVSYYLLCMIAVLMKLFWCGNETSQDKQIRKLKGFRVI